MINTHITTFPSLPNLNIASPPQTTVSELLNEIYARLSLAPSTQLSLSTTSGRLLNSSSPTTLSSLSSHDDFITLRLTVPVCGGKGGFGSQLRAAGGRMSSRKKSQENSDSCRNLDGRRMRTVKEAKALAAWLEIKPEMEKKEREERMKRWRDIVEQAERREENASKVRFDDSEWLENLEEGKERTREAVLASMKAAGMVDEESSGESSGEDEKKERIRKAVKDAEAAAPSAAKDSVNRFAGWDDDEFMSDGNDGEMDDIPEEDEEGDVKGKGKAVA